MIDRKIETRDRDRKRNHIQERQRLGLDETDNREKAGKRLMKEREIETDKDEIDCLKKALKFFIDYQSSAGAPPPWTRSGRSSEQLTALLPPLLLQKGQSKTTSIIG